MGLWWIPKWWFSIGFIIRKFPQIPYENDFQCWIYILLWLQFKFTLFRKMGNMEYRPFMMINVTAEICSVMSGATNAFVNLFAKQLKTYSNLYQPCPYRGHIYIKEHDLDINDFPPILPAGFYYSHFIFYTKYQKADRVVIRTKTHFEIIPKGIERF